MCVKKWICCAILFYICYLIVKYLDKRVENFGRGGRGGFGRGRGGYYGGRGGYYGGRGGYYGGGYYGGRDVVYPVVIADNSYPSYWWYRYVPFFGY